MCDQQDLSVEGQQRSFLAERQGLLQKDQSRRPALTRLLLVQGGENVTLTSIYRANCQHLKCPLEIQVCLNAYSETLPTNLFTHALRHARQAVTHTHTHTPSRYVIAC